MLGGACSKQIEFKISKVWMAFLRFKKKCARMQKNKSLLASWYHRPNPEDCINRTPGDPKNDQMTAKKQKTKNQKNK